MMIPYEVAEILGKNPKSNPGSGQIEAAARKERLRRRFLPPASFCWNSFNCCCLITFDWWTFDDVTGVSDRLPASKYQTADPFITLR